MVVNQRPDVRGPLFEGGLHLFRIAKDVVNALHAFEARPAGMVDAPFGDFSCDTKPSETCSERAPKIVKPPRQRHLLKIVGRELRHFTVNVGFCFTKSARRPVAAEDEIMIGRYRI